MRAERYALLGIVASVWVCATATSVVGQGDRLAGRISGSAGTTADMGPLEVERIKKLREFYEARNSGEVLKITGPIDLENKSFAFCREMLLVESESYRRIGSYAIAAGKLKQIYAHVKKVPEVQRQGVAAFAALPLKVYRYSRAGVYRSPRRKGKVGPPTEEQQRISDDGVWEAAKLDYAEYMLGELDKGARRVNELHDPRNLMYPMTQALGVVDLVRPHFEALANQRAVSLIATYVGRYDQIMDPPCGRHLEDVRKWHTGQYWRYMKVGFKDRQRITDGLLERHRSLITLNYGWGRTVVQYCRDKGLLADAASPISSLRNRKTRLEDSFVRFDNRVWKSRVHKLWGRNDPLSKIPSAEW